MAFDFGGTEVQAEAPLAPGVDVELVEVVASDYSRHQ